MRLKSIYLLFVAVSFSTLSCSYLPDEGINAEGYTIGEEKSHFFLLPSGGNQNKTGIIFYPGGLVDPTGYIDLMGELSTKLSRPVILLKATGNLSIYNPNLASKVLEEYKGQYNNWVIAGHSLGGVVAGQAVAKNPELYSGMLLMASHSISDLANWQKPILILTGQNDEVYDATEIENNSANIPPISKIDSLDNLPADGTVGQTILYEIKGGNHSQFGSYGHQKGDGEAGISEQEQHDEIVRAIDAFFISNNIK